MSNAPSWDDFVKDANQPTVFDFWLKKGEKAQIVFLDDARYPAYQHGIKNGNKFETIICSGANCACCTDPDRNVNYRAPVQSFTVLDLRPYTNKKGETVSFTRKRLAVKKEVVAILDLRRGSTKDGTLTNKVFNVMRTDVEKSPASGNDFEFVREADATKLPPEAKPFNFQDVLRPLPREKMVALLASVGKGGGGQDQTFSRDQLGGADPTEADIPF